MPDVFCPSDCGRQNLGRCAAEQIAANCNVSISSHLSLFPRPVPPLKQHHTCVLLISRNFHSSLPSYRWARLCCAADVIMAVQPSSAGVPTGRIFPSGSAQGP
jgi:hypothetical protein